MDGGGMYSGKRYGMGWIPDYPDFRDYTERHEDGKMGRWEDKKTGR